jgi:hypothetical protein
MHPPLCQHAILAYKHECRAILDPNRDWGPTNGRFVSLGTGVR